jgi:hypothetical protein
MADRDDRADESEIIIREIETNLEAALRKRREEVERELDEKIRREQEESERKIKLIEQEYDKERSALQEYRGAVSDFDAARRALQTQMHEHLDRAARCQEEIEKLTASTLEELKRVGALSVELAVLRRTSETKIAQIRSKLKESYGIETEPAPGREVNDLVADMEHELAKLKTIKDLLDKESNSVPHVLAPASPTSPADLPEEAEIGPPETIEPGESRVEFQMPEIDRLVEDLAGVQRTVPESLPPERAPEVGEEKESSPDETGFQTAFESLEKYRTTEQIEDDGEISFFQRGGRVVLDGESLVRSIAGALDKGKLLARKLDETGSPKEQFFIKQELINCQEALRKAVLRAVRLCEKESGSFPSYIAGILNTAILKEILEKLSMDNWSNPENLRAFDEYAARLAGEFYKRITPPVEYLRSILAELET